MKRSARTILLGSLILILVAPAATAENPFARDRSRRDAAADRAQKIDHFPSMEFLSGTLHRNSPGGWQLDGLQLRLVRDCHVQVDGSLLPGILESGRSALVMGHRAGDVFVVCRVRILRPSYDLSPVGADGLAVQWSDTDPSVGVGQGPE